VSTVGFDRTEREKMVTGRREEGQRKKEGNGEGGEGPSAARSRGASITYAVDAGEPKSWHNPLCMS
jgi:hypothetical protein